MQTAPPATPRRFSACQHEPNERPSRGLAIGAGVLVLVAVALNRVELIVELDDIADTPSMERIREKDEESR